MAQHLRQSATEQKKQQKGQGEQQKGQQEKKKLRITPKRALIGGGILLAAVLVAVGVWAALYTQRIDEGLAFDGQAQASISQALVAPKEVDDPYYVLLLGSDSRTPGDYTGRSDTIILARIDPEVPQAMLLSIPRDTEIQLEGYGSQKINSAYTYGQQAGAIQAVSALCGVDIAHYVEINFEGVVGLVDTLGGVTVDVPVSVYLDGVSIEPGEQRLDGAQALILSRCRSYPTGDYQRVVNQRILLKAVVKEVLAADPVALPGLIEGLAACVRTDLTSLDAVSLLLGLKDIQDDDIYMETIPSYNNYHDEASYIAIQEPEFSEMMERVRQGLPPVDPDASATPETDHYVVTE
ncbi:MAG: LCP family protein [Coriobacteriales bacterium]|jgi:LCP family protein required for cell wall assembly|nr:LCP family protein [Coriobacteriales bacterium]